MSRTHRREPPRYGRYPRLASLLAALAGGALALASVGSGAAGAAVGSATRGTASIPTGLRSTATPAPSRGLLLALGDSLAAGYQPTDGTSPPPVDTATGAPDQGYPGGYAADVARSEHLHLLDLACPGETTTSFRGTPARAACGAFYRQHLGARSQLAAALAALARYPGQVRIVTFDLGGNDLDGCFSRGSISERCLLGRFSAVESRLPAILSTLKSALARDDPGGRLVAMDYYDPFLGLAFHPGGTRGAALAALSLAGLHAFDAELRADYRRAGALTAKVAAEFESTALRPFASYGGKRLPRNVALVCRWTYMCPLPGSAVRSPDVHPSTAGYARIALAFERALSR